MTIDRQDFMHGAALAAIASADGFTALNKMGTKRGHYVVNHDRHIFIKYTLSDGPEFIFAFNDSDKLELAATTGVAKVFAVLVCADVAIAAVPVEDLSKVIDLHKPTTEHVYVSAEPGKQLRVSGPQGELPHPIARNAFPLSVLG